MTKSSQTTKRSAKRQALQALIPMLVPNFEDAIGAFPAGQRAVQWAVPDENNYRGAVCILKIARGI